MKPLPVVVALLVGLGMGYYEDSNKKPVDPAEQRARIVADQEALRSDAMNMINRDTNAKCYAALHAYENFDGFHVLCANNNDVAFGEVEATAKNTTAYLLVIGDNGRGGVMVTGLERLDAAGKAALFHHWEDYLNKWGGHHER